MKTPDRGAFLLAAPAHLLLALTITIPAVYILWLSLNDSTFGTQLTFVGLSNYFDVFADPSFWNAAKNTFFVVNGIVYVEILLATLIAAVLVSGVPFRPVLIAIILVPYAASEVVTVLVWKSLMNPSYGMIGRTLIDLGMGLNWSVSPSDALVLVGIISVWQHLPFSFLLIYAGMMAIPKSLYEAAAIDGAGAIQTFFKVTLPLLVPTILVAIIFRFVFAFRLFSEVWLLTGGGPARMTEVLAVYLYRDAYRTGDFGAAAATGWLMVVGTLLFASVYLWFMHRGMRNGNV
ncbi:carbohydrate ABC transporter permease [Devosia ginsengisoli]|uniref:carbohydrate ABC transporter permease n=1 Tax=Devosia ginsengisoli TaxID=400770 RepID=UPI0026F07F62|nr:sugar ABC transporter permease [Devosia ginsengisoli]MCR6670146.1 sugar ABC transporter permease [Devosia ginsengisoli]